jgi:tetratricopeptide (TPR) repeat protein
VALVTLAVLHIVLGTATAVGAAPSSAPDALVAEGDAHYLRRADGASDAVADAAPIEAAIEAYRRALALAPEDNGALFRLLRALHFRASFTGAEEALQRRIYDEGTRLGQQAVDRMEKRADGKGRVEALRAIPDAGEVYFWTAACWGQWGLLRGTFASARKGIAGRMRDLATTVNEIDPTIQQGGGYRLLGRLHDRAPRIPLVTGWISRRKAVEYLRRSYELGPDNHVTWYFLAEALLEHQPKARDEAKALLERCATAEPHPEYLVEDRHYARLAKIFLKTAN